MHTFSLTMLSAVWHIALSSSSDLSTLAVFEGNGEEEEADFTGIRVIWKVIVLSICIIFFP